MSKVSKITPTILGTFSVRRPRLIVSDPCYKADDGNLNAAIYPALTGTWIAESYVSKLKGSTDWGKRCFRLLAYHESAADKVHHFRFQHETNCAVDSGLMSVFDAGQYNRDESVPGNLLFSGQFASCGEPQDGVRDANRFTHAGDRWYEWILMLMNREYDSLADREGVTVFNGAVVTSGLGDNVYPLGAHYRAKYLYRKELPFCDAIRVDFIDFKDALCLKSKSI